MNAWDFLSTVQCGFLFFVALSWTCMKYWELWFFPWDMRYAERFIIIIIIIVIIIFIIVISSSSSSSKDSIYI